MIQGETRYFQGRLYYFNEPDAKWYPVPMQVAVGGGGTRRITNNIISGGVLNFKRQIPSSDYQKIYSNPITLLPALTGNKYYSIDIFSIAFRKLAGSIPYDWSNGDTFMLTYDVTSLNGRIFLIPDSTFNTISEISIQNLLPPPGYNGMDFLNNPVILKQDGNPPGTGMNATQGNGDVIITFNYSILDLN